MSTQRCDICGEWYLSAVRDPLELCDGCLPNFAGAQPPLDIHTPMAREALEAYVYPDHQITPRQAQALARMHVDWQRPQAGEDTP